MSAAAAPPDEPTAPILAGEPDAHAGPPGTALEALATLADRLVASPRSALPPLTLAQRLELAWALKARCYEAWSTEPAATVRAAQALRQVQTLAPAQPAQPADPADAAGTAGADETPAGAHELAALADWCEAIAALTRGEMLAALEALDRAADTWHRLGRPREAGQTQVPKLMALSILGRFDEAEACAVAATATLLAAGDTAAAARVSLNRGSLAMQRAAFQQAVQPYREAAALFARAGDRAHSVMADIGLADACTMLGRGDEAAQLYERARLRAARHGLQVLEASARDGLATLALSRGQPAAALAGLEAARRAWQALDLPQLQAEAEHSLADAYLEVRLLPEAIALYQDLLARPGALESGATQPWTLLQLGRAQALNGEASAALATLDRAARVFEREEIPVGLAAVGLARGELQLAAGDAPSARDSAEAAAAGFEDEGVRFEADRARWLAAAAARAAGDLDAARAGCEALLARPDLPAPLRVRVQVERAAGWQRQGRHAEARDALEQAIDEIELMHDTLPGDDLRRAFLDDGATAHVERLRLALEPAGPGSGPGDPAEVLHWLDRLKDRAVAGRWGAALGPAAPQDGPGEAAAAPAQEDEDTAALRARLDALYRRRRRRTEDEEPPVPAFDEALLRLERELLERARRARLMAAGAATGPAAPGAVGPASGPAPGPASAPPPRAGGDTRLAGALRAHLAPDAALVEYGHLDDELFAVVVGPRGLRLQRRLGRLAEVRRAVEGLHFQLESMRPGGAVLGPHARQLEARARTWLRRLHDLVWAPLADALDGVARVCVVPQDALHQLPFAALESEHGALVDRHELTLASSARGLLAAPADGPRPAHPALLLGDPIALPQVERELQAVARALGGGATRLQTLADWRERCGDAGLLHLACHADFRPDSPLHSALHVGDASLTAADVGQLALQARLVVLSACETGAGLSGGRVDASLGLTRAFRLSGAGRVLASLWRVDDGATADLMVLFHQAWRQLGAIGPALQSAQRSLRERQPHPFHWAAFQLHV